MRKIFEVLNAKNFFTVKKIILFDPLNNFQYFDNKKSPHQKVIKVHVTCSMSPEFSQNMVSFVVKWLVQRPIL